ncbi:hypothetical protein [Nonomuraea sp. NPDC049646]|uniref:hypothetical protein n=1 Tax=unclassified Nonomuraea TaxID=2593643 RepID=UPI0037B62D1C
MSVLRRFVLPAVGMTAIAVLVVWIFWQLWLLLELMAAQLVVLLLVMALGVAEPAAYAVQS